MKPSFDLHIESIEIVNELPGAWPPSQCLALLERLEFDGADALPPEQRREYAVMALQDLDEPEAARALLDIVLGDRLSDGKKQNSSEEMASERLWEEHPDLSCHEPIFNAQVLLHQAFPQAQAPEVHRVQATLRPLDPAAGTFLQEALSKGLPEAFVARCLAAASTDNSILNRLFEDGIRGGAFPDAEHLVWQVESQALPADGPARPGARLALFSPIRWTDTLEEGSTTCSPPIDGDDDDS